MCPRRRPVTSGAGLSSSRRRRSIVGLRQVERGRSEVQMGMKLDVENTAEAYEC